METKETSIEAKATLLSGSRSSVSVGGGDTTLDGQTVYGTTFGIESAAADRVCVSYRTLPLTENDIEFGNDARQVIAFGAGRYAFMSARSMVKLDTNAGKPSLTPLH
jgi:hypothetical protein